MAVIDSDIQAKEPEYLSWDLERLRQEYSALNLKHVSLKLQIHNDQLATEKLENLRCALRDVLEGENDS